MKARREDESIQSTTDQVVLKAKDYINGRFNGKKWYICQVLNAIESLQGQASWSYTSCGKNYWVVWWRMMMIMMNMMKAMMVRGLWKNILLGFGKPLNSWTRWRRSFRTENLFTKLLYRLCIEFKMGSTTRELYQWGRSSFPRPSRFTQWVQLDGNVIHRFPFWNYKSHKIRVTEGN